jgi:DNA repair exonuclease SbcCD nuclease subunit
MKYINIADLHFGNAGDSVFHNQNLLDFFIFLVDWKEKNAPDAELNILGDVFHSRHKLSSETINYALKGIEYLAGNFSNVNIVVGNHDMYHRDRTDINSVNIFKHIENVYIIDSMLVSATESVMWHPWVIDERDYANLIEATEELNIKILFSHLEFSTFKMNDNYVMEHGLTHKSLKHVEKIFTGHYHGRQEMDNVIYIGNPFPFDFNDANNTDKGFCVVDTDTCEHFFVDWDEISVYSLTYDEFLEIDWEKLPEDYNPQKD